jgi:hypothetical protein
VAAIAWQKRCCIKFYDAQSVHKRVGLPSLRSEPCRFEEQFVRSMM